ncbi:MAG: glycosyltransferase family 39 protein [Desulfarculaceae bacterium]|nr:glycosyltransferase family 39 protein [Desulfarculaceae bacterium]MCF8072759.1 glycosyltransferase family 39 protein [Desulfarculaceae bacterium]MCF8100927.1 glycosyltransferase family 39 protein [Desulfarculaceae bacterium]MCF8118551.1 glycosyltransferase family 39 protein [Desulfarculaceae bacterium]
MRVPWPQVLLGLIVLLGLGLRLWGINWPENMHPDEWTSRMVAAFAGGSLYYPHPVIWHQAFYLLAGYLYAPAQFLLGKSALLLGPGYAVLPVIPHLVWGRLMVALLGVVNIWALYRLVLACNLGRAAALTGALLLAVSPLLVVHSHYLTVDVPLALAITLSLWAGVRLVADPRWWRYLVAGLAIGLTLTTKANGGLVLTSLVLAHVLVVLRDRPAWPRWLLAWPGVFAGAMAAGMIVGYPGFVLHHENPILKYAGQVHNFTRPHFAEKISLLNSPIGDRLTWSAHTLGDSVGWVLVALFAVGLGLALWQRRRSLWVVGSYPVFYYLVVLVFSHRLAERDLTSLVPPLICLGLFPLVWGWARLPRGWRRALWVGAALALALVPLGHSISGAYLFWQQETRISAQHWLEANFTPQDKLYLSGYGPPKHPPQAEFFHSHDPDAYAGPHNYLLYSSTAEDRHWFQWGHVPRNQMGRFMQGVDEKFLLIKEFDLGYDTQADKRPGRFKFPVFVDPLLRLYAARPPLAQKESLGLERPPAASTAPWAVVYTNHPAYSAQGADALARGPARAVRVLRPPHELLAVEVELVNLGQRPVRVKLVQGPVRKHLRLKPGQTWRNLGRPLSWPVPLKRVYPFTLWLEEPGLVYMRLRSDPLKLGLACLERGQWDLAGRLLTQAHGLRPAALLPRALGAAAHLGLGRTAPAASLLAGQEAALERLARLVLHDGRPEVQPARLAAWAGLYPDLMTQALTRRYLPGPYDLQAGLNLEQRQPAFEFSARPGNRKTPPVYELALRELLPPWPQKAKLGLAWDQLPLMAEGPLAMIQAQAMGPLGKGPLIERELVLADLAAEPGSKDLELDLPSAGPGARWRLRLLPRGGAPIRLMGVEMTTSALDQVAKAALWAFWAQGELMRRQGRPGPAAAILAWGQRLDPSFGPGLKSLVEALVASGQPKEAKERLQGALPLLAGRAELAAWTRERLAQLADTAPAPR